MNFTRKIAERVIRFFGKPEYWKRAVSVTAALARLLLKWKMAVFLHRPPGRNMQPRWNLRKIQWMVKPGAVWAAA